MAPWRRPQDRIARYVVAIAYRFHFDPRAIDEWTIVEFDRFARQCDAFDEQERDQERQSARSRSARQ